MAFHTHFNLFILLFACNESLGLDVELLSATAEGPADSLDLPQLPTGSSNSWSAAAPEASKNCMDSASASSMCNERKFIIFESCVRQLLPKSCQMCGRPWSSSLKTVGTMLSVKSCCDHCANEAAWQSQPFVGVKPAGNVLLAAALLFSECSVAKTLRFLKAMNVQGISRQTYFRYQTCYLVPAVSKASIVLASTSAAKCTICNIHKIWHHNRALGVMRAPQHRSIGQLPSICAFTAFNVNIHIKASVQSVPECPSSLSIDLVTTRAANEVLTETERTKPIVRFRYFKIRCVAKQPTQPNTREKLSKS